MHVDVPLTSKKILSPSIDDEFQYSDLKKAEKADHLIGRRRTVGSDAHSDELS